LALEEFARIRTANGEDAFVAEGGEKRGIGHRVNNRWVNVRAIIIKAAISLKLQALFKSWEKA
jgi:hypothetical protein